MNVEDLNARLNQSANQVWDGVAIWKKVKSELHMPDSSCILLFPSAKRAANIVFLRYIEQLVKRKEYTCAYVLAVDEWTVKNASAFTDSIAGTMQLSEYESACILKYYSLIEFSNRFYVCDITFPEGRLGELLIENSIPIDEIVCAGVYRMYDYEKVYNEQEYSN